MLAFKQKSGEIQTYVNTFYVFYRFLILFYFINPRGLELKNPYTANVLTIKTTGTGKSGPLQGKSALSMEKGCKNCGETL